MVNVPATKDLIQKVEGNLKIPEIRVWIHPNKFDKPGNDYYYVFKDFESALKFIETHKEEAEPWPLLAVNGYEINVFDIEPPE